MNNSETNHFGNFLRNARTKIGKKQFEIAIDVQSSQQLFSQWENGKVIPSKKNLEKRQQRICEVLSVSETELLDAWRHSFMAKHGRPYSNKDKSSVALLAAMERLIETEISPDLMTAAAKTATTLPGPLKFYDWIKIIEMHLPKSEVDSE